MELNCYSDVFKTYIAKSGDYFNITFDKIEKDYYITRFLKEIESINPHILFKGGTSLSKAFHVIDRFSEDIDLTLDADYQSISKRRDVKYQVIDVCKRLNLTLLNEEETRSRRDYNCYNIKYPIITSSENLNQQLKVEVTFIEKEYPYVIMPISSLIGEYLEKINRYDLIEKYSLQSFNMHINALERTFIDKVFATCDYFLCNKSTRASRHIYDLYKIYDRIKIDDEFKKLAISVRNDRQPFKRCLSAKDGISINNTLKEIIDKKYYKEDYENITKNFLYDDISYDSIIQVLYKIIDSGAFKNE